MKPIMIVLAFLTVFCPRFTGQDRNFTTDEALKTFSTEHFRIIYQEPLAGSAPMIAGYCEEAFGALTRVFRWTPEGRIDILFMDSADTHNGWATVVPHKMVAIYAAGSEPGSSIYQPGDYLRRTVYHELAHVFVMDISNGYDKVMSGIFGRVLPFDLISGILALVTFPPAVLAPDWLLEGFSIWAETEFVPPGRGKSSFVDMIFRCAVRDDRLLSYEKWYLEIPHWPFGLAAYLYGMKLIQYTCETAKDKENPVGDLAQAVSETILFDLKSAFRDATGRSLEQLAGLMLKNEKQVQQNRLRILMSAPETEALRLTPEEIQVFSPIYVNDKIFFLGRETERRSTMYCYEPGTRNTRKIDAARVTPSNGNLATRPGGRFIYYTRLDLQAQENLWYEIRRFNTWTDDDELVTNQGRYKAIAISRNGRKLAAVGREGCLHCLVEFDLDEETGRLSNRELLVSAPLHCDLTTPSYAPDGQRICWTEADADGYRLVVFDRQTRATKTVLDREHQVLMPVWLAVKDAIVFSSDENGVYNLYEVLPEEAGAPSPLTNVTGGLFFPTPSLGGDKLAAVGFDSQGAYLTTLPYSPDALSNTALPAIASLWEGSPSTGPLKTAPEVTEEKETPDSGSGLSAAEDYNSFANLRFDFWSPWLSSAGHGIKTGVAAFMSDPALYQDVTLVAGVQPTYHSPLGAFHYVYRRFFPEIHLYGAADQEYYYDLLKEKDTENRFDYGEETGTFGLSVSVPLTRLDHRLLLDAGYEYRLRNQIEEIAEEYDGRILSTLPTRESEASVWMKTIYFDGTAFPRSVSVEDGRWITAGVERSDENLGGDVTRMRYLAEWNEYISVPWKKNHVLKLSASYGFSHGDQNAQGTYSIGGMTNPISDILPGLPGKLQVRGYPDNFQTGKNAARASMSYRFPLYDFSTGSEGFVPVYTNQIFGEVFHDTGRTWDRTGGGDDLKWISATGIEANISLQLMRFIRFAPGVGLVYIPDRARRYDEDKRVVGYLSIKAWVNF
ncbi:MAG: hypothetical protein ABIK28_17265 [Planctomycetota bacterium]